MNEILRRPLGLLLSDAERGDPETLRRFSRAARAAALEFSRDSGPVVGGRPLPQLVLLLRELANRADTNAFAKGGGGVISRAGARLIAQAQRS
jgi:hypothetical protein